VEKVKCFLLERRRALVVFCASGVLARLWPHENLSRQKWSNDVHFAEERESERDGNPMNNLSRARVPKKFDTHLHTLSRTCNERVSKMFYFHKKLYCVYRTLLYSNIYIYFVHARMRSNDSFLPAGVIVLETSLTVSLIERERESCAPSQAAVSSCFVWFFFFFFSFPSEEHSEKYF